MPVGVHVNIKYKNFFRKFEIFILSFQETQFSSLKVPPDNRFIIGRNSSGFGDILVKITKSACDIADLFGEKRYF